MLGFGILFLGIHFMKEAFSPLKDYSAVQDALIWLGGNPILAVMAGTVITMLLQSSSASIAMIQTLAAVGAFGLADWHQVLQVTIPFILGDNIGTTITAQLAALQASRNAKRAAMGHTMFNVIGVLYMLPLVWFGWYAHLVERIVWAATVMFKDVTLSQMTIMFYIAVAHSVFNVFNTIIFMPLIGVLAAAVMKILPVTERESDRRPVALEEHLLDTPVIALAQSQKEIIRMGKAARKAVQFAINGIVTDDRKLLSTVRELEDFTDEFQLDITSYLTTLSGRQLSHEVSTRLPVLLHAVNDLERVGDLAVNIAEIAARKIEQKLVFSEDAAGEVEQLRKEVFEMFDAVEISMETGDVFRAQAALANEDNLNRMQMEFRRSHVQRMSDGVCGPHMGLIFIDLVDNVEKIGDHLTNIIQAVMGGLQWEGVSPKKSTHATRTGPVVD